MPEPPSYLRQDQDSVLLAVKLLPRSSVNEIGDPLGDELRIKVTAPPVDSAANEALVAFLAKRLGCARGRVELVQGRASRHKKVRLHGFALNDVLEKFECARR